MKELSMLFIILGTLLVGSFQKEQIETKTGYLDLKEKSGIAIFSKAVTDSTLVKNHIPFGFQKTMEQ